MISLYYHANLDDNFSVSIEPHSATEKTGFAYYTLKVCSGITMFLTPRQAYLLAAKLNSRPDLPFPDTQRDAAAEDTGFAPTSGDTEAFRG
jgi:hypothetical protein